MPEDLTPAAFDFGGLKRISGTRYMPFFKYVLPCVMYAGVCAWMLSDESKKPRPDYPTLAVVLVIVGVIMVVVFKRRMWGLADEVLDGGDHLLIRRGKRETRIELANVSEVSLDSGPPTKVTLQLKIPSEFGPKISFVPNATSRNPLATSSIAEDLVQRVRQLNGDRAT
jgi:hypothetical protein